MSTEAMKLALEALEGSTDKTLSIRAITALQEELAQPQQKPVAIVDDSGVIVVCSYHYKPGDKLYTVSPAQRKPLTDEELEEIVKRGAENKPFHHWFARAIEAAHGIKGDA